MVTLLDTGLLNFLLPVFSFLLIYALIFAILQKYKVTDSTNANAWIAFAISALFAVTPGAMNFVSVIAPWFVVMLIIIFSFMILFLFMGVELKTFEGVAREPAVRWTIIILGVIVIIAGLTSVFGPIFGTPTPDSGGGVAREVQRSVFDPQILTTVFILLVIGQAVRLIAQKD